MKKVVHYVLTVALLMTFSMIQAQYLKFFKGSTFKGKPPSQVTLVDQTHIDINTADADALGKLKGIGPKKGKAIINYRKQHGAFKSVEKIAEVPGIGKKSLARILKNNPDRLVANP